MAAVSTRHAPGSGAAVRLYTHAGHSEQTVGAAGSNASPDDQVQVLLREVENLGPNVTAAVLRRVAARLQQLAAAAASREGEAGGTRIV